MEENSEVILVVPDRLNLFRREAMHAQLEADVLSSRCERLIFGSPLAEILFEPDLQQTRDQIPQLLTVVVSAQERLNVIHIVHLLSEVVGACARMIQ